MWKSQKSNPFSLHFIQQPFSVDATSTIVSTRTFGIIIAGPYLHKLAWIWFMSIEEEEEVVVGEGEGEEDGGEKKRKQSLL